MAATPDRRQPGFVNRKFQLGLAWRLVFVYLGLYYAGVVLLFAPSMYGLASGAADLAAREAASTEFLLLHRRAWPPVLLSFAGIFVYTLIFSHRIAGPLHRINDVLRKMIDGEDPGPIAFRKNDYFKPTADLLTALSKKLSGGRPDPAEGSNGPAGGPPEANPPDARRGFTLVEMAIALFVIGILATISVTVYRWMIHQARMTQARVALTHLKKTETIYFNERDRYTDDTRALYFDPADYEYYVVSVTLTDNVHGRSYRAFAVGRGAMAGDLWTVTDNADPVQDNSSPFRTAGR